MKRVKAAARAARFLRKGWNKIEANQFLGTEWLGKFKKGNKSLRKKILKKS